MTAKDLEKLLVGFAQSLEGDEQETFLHMLEDGRLETMFYDAALRMNVTREVAQAMRESVQKQLVQSVRQSLLSELETSWRSPSTKGLTDAIRASATRRQIAYS